MNSNLIKLRVSHAIQGIYVSCCNTSLHLAGKIFNVNMYRFFCKKKNYFLQQLFATCNNLLISCKV